MIKIVSNSQMRAMDKKAVEQFSIPGIVLMENAGRNSAETIIEFCNEKSITAIIIFCGKGNNGGDGFVIARYLDKAGFDVIVYLAAEKSEIRGDALTNLNISLNSKIFIEEIQNTENLISANNILIVDALLGTGVKGAAKGLYAEIIKWINKQDAFVCAVDIPSGVNGDDATLSGDAVRADFTVTMGLPKLAQFFYPVRSLIGDLEVIDIGFPVQIENDPSISVQAVFEEDIEIPIPDPALYKHKAGKVFILGGSPGLTGAVVLSAKGASAGGAGLVYAGVAVSLNPVLENKLTEQMTLPLPETDPGILSPIALKLIGEKIDWCHTLLIGPGMGRNPVNAEIIKQSVKIAVEQNKNVVIDADALFFFSHDKMLLKTLNEKCIITPHHAEFLRLFPKAEGFIKSQPWQALQDFIGQYKVVTNLKGAPSMAGASKKGIFINTTGNPGLAKGGSGDLLGGMIAGMTAAGIEPLQACINANFIHGKAADNAVEKWGMRSFSLENLIDEVKLVIKDYY